MRATLSVFPVFSIYSHCGEDRGWLPARGQSENQTGAWWDNTGCGWRWCRKGEWEMAGSVPVFISRSSSSTPISSFINIVNTEI